MQVSIACNVAGGAGGGGASGEHVLKERRSANQANAANVAQGRARVEPTRTLGHAHMNEAPGCHGNMMYRSLGVSGLRVSCLGLGTWVTFGSQISDEEAEQILTLAYDSGVNLFDTAEVYAAGRAETTLGSILKKKSWSRSSFVVTTKIYWGGQAETERGLSRKHIIEGLKSSLCRLQLDYVDIVFANRSDISAPMEEVVRAMSFLVDQGLALHWGTSHWSSAEIMEAYSVARQFNLDAPVCEQSEYHYFHRDKVELQLPELYHKIGVGVVTWSPLASGLITGKYNHGVPQRSRATVQGYSWLRERLCSDEGKKQLSKVQELHQVAESLNCTPAQLAIGSTSKLQLQMKLIEVGAGTGTICISIFGNQTMSVIATKQQIRSEAVEAWCLRSGGVSSVLLGVSNVEQLQENLGSIKVLSLLDESVLSQIDRLLGNKPEVKRRGQPRP